MKQILVVVTILLDVLYHIQSNLLIFQELTQDAQIVSLVLFLEIVENIGIMLDGKITQFQLVVQMRIMHQVVLIGQLIQITQKIITEQLLDGLVMLMFQDVLKLMKQMNVELIVILLQYLQILIGVVILATVMDVLTLTQSIHRKHL